MLVECYRNYSYAISYQITLHEQDALDVTQQVFLRLVERIGSFNGRGAFRAWLGALTANDFVDGAFLLPQTEQYFPRGSQ